MHAVIRGVEVQDQLGRWRGKGGDELREKHLVEGHGRPAVRARFQAAEGGAAGEVRVALQGRLPGQIVAQRVVIVEVLVAQGQSENALAQEVHLPVGDQKRVARVAQPPIQGGAEAQAAVRLAQEQNAPVAGDVAAGEAGLDFTAIKAWKVAKVLRTIWHERSPGWLWVRTTSTLAACRRDFALFLHQR